MAKLVEGDKFDSNTWNNHVVMVGTRKILKYIITFITTFRAYLYSPMPVTVELLFAR